jgi:hypothetical protein
MYILLKVLQNDQDYLFADIDPYILGLDIGILENLGFKDLED